MAKIDAAEIYAILFKEQGSSPPTPAAGYAKIFVNTTPALAFRDDGGTVKALASELDELSDVSAAAQTANFVLCAGTGAGAGDYRGRLLVKADIPFAEPNPLGATTAAAVYASSLGLGASSSSYGWIKYVNSTKELTGATSTIEVNIPAYSVILGVTINVDEAVVDDGGDDTWSAEFNDGGTVLAIASGAAAAQNTKVRLVCTQATDAETDILLTPNGGSFTDGTIRVQVFWFELSELPNA
jgi:hypothetical protein